jgi:hypothetical protein
MGKAKQSDDTWHAEEEAAQRRDELIPHPDPPTKGEPTGYVASVLQAQTNML